MSSLDFSHQEVLRARTYHRPLYLALVADTALVRGRSRRARVGVERSVPPRLRARLGGRGGRIRGDRDHVVIARAASARLLAGLRPGAALGLLDPDRGCVARRPDEGLGRVGRARRGRVDGGRRARARVPVGLAGGRGGRARGRRPRALVPDAARVRAALQPLRAARGRAAGGRAARSRGARRRSGARHPRRRREPADDEGERVRVRAGADAPRRALRHAADERRRAGDQADRRTRARPPARAARRQGDAAGNGVRA